MPAGERPSPSGVLASPASPRRGVGAPGDDLSIPSQTISDREESLMLTHLWFRKGSRKPRAPGDRERFRRACRLCLEPLEDRCLLSGDVVVRWNELLLQAAQH